MVCNCYSYLYEWTIGKNHCQHLLMCKECSNHLNHPKIQDNKYMKLSKKQDILCVYIYIHVNIIVFMCMYIYIYTHRSLSKQTCRMPGPSWPRLWCSHFSPRQADGPMPSFRSSKRYPRYMPDVIIKLQLYNP